ncbi:hypothetical protein [Streptomyces dysideae]|uniref:Uncharacterized protein n=1 Tax=Streptomyces dysideae TaxID=909626 RepID=A0A101UU60_9ACTN|nr:hypothetical protein [Streptomyces dysideae]KUO16930.1 hypothetical protein AQJ91_33465 [Streptomyces dysideae]
MTQAWGSGNATGLRSPARFTARTPKKTVSFDRSTSWVVTSPTGMTWVRQVPVLLARLVDADVLVLVGEVGRFGETGGRVAAFEERDVVAAAAVAVAAVDDADAHAGGVVVGESPTKRDSWRVGESFSPPTERRIAACSGVSEEGTPSCPRAPPPPYRRSLTPPRSPPSR